MDITAFVVSLREQAFLYGDYATYHRQLAKKLHNARRKLNIVTKNRGKFANKGSVTSEQIAGNHEYLHLLILTSERAWAHGMRLKAVHSTDAKGITGRTRSHIVSRLDKSARTAEQLVTALSDSAASGATSNDLLEAKAYASLIRGATDFEKHSWESCLQNYSTARIIYTALSSVVSSDALKDLLSETIDPSIRYAAYQLKVPRTLAIPSIARKAFPTTDTALVEQINSIDSSLLKQGVAESNKGQLEGTNAPQTITWRNREVQIEDAAIAIALASTEAAVARLAERLSSSDVTLPKERAAAYDEVLTASQDVADAAKHAIDELREEGVSQNDPRIQSLQITRTAVNYQMISWRIGRNRVLSGEHDGALLDSAPNTTRKAKKDATGAAPKPPKPRLITQRKPDVKYQDRTAVRLVLQNSTGEIAILSAKKDDYHKLPGGGVEAGEERHDAVRREALEETGCRIDLDSDSHFAATEEFRDESHQVSYAYVGTVQEDTGKTSLTAEEIADGLTLSWTAPEKALQLMRAAKPKSDFGKSVQAREVYFLTKWLELRHRNGSLASRPREQAAGRKIARLKEKVVLYDATLQSLESIKELPGVAADEALLEQLEAVFKYFHALKCLSIARSHSVAGNSVNALALIKHAFDEFEAATSVLAAKSTSTSEDAPLSIDIRKSDIVFLSGLLKGELQRSRALVEIDNLRKQSDSTGASARTAVVERLSEYPAEGADLENLVVYPPKMEPIPVKPLFFDVAWNYIDYPGQKTAAASGASTASSTTAGGQQQSAAESGQTQKRGWFGFGR